jgi:hypothetical protein
LENLNSLRWNNNPPMRNSLQAMAGGMALASLEAMARAVVMEEAMIKARDTAALQAMDTVEARAEVKAQATAAIIAVKRLQYFHGDDYCHNMEGITNTNELGSI